MGEARANRLAQPCRGNRAQQFAVRRVHNRVAPRQHSERRQSLQPGRRPVQTSLARVDDLSRSAVQALICALQTAMDGGDACCNVLMTQAGDEKRKPLRSNTQGTLRRRIQAEAQLIEALVAAVNCVAQADQDGLRRETSIALSCTHQMEMACTLRTGRKYRDAIFNVLLGSSDQLSRCRWSGGAQVSDKVRNREVCLVTDGRYDRKLRACNRAGKPFVVETGEVFQRPAATRNDDEIHKRRVCIKPANACSNRAWTRRPLHRCRKYKQVQTRMSPPHDRDNVA